jgi:hypothetical protein
MQFQNYPPNMHMNAAPISFDKKFLNNFDKGHNNFQNQNT